MGVDLGRVSDSYDYLKIIADATAGTQFAIQSLCAHLALIRCFFLVDIDVQIVFNNAGYIVMKVCFWRNTREGERERDYSHIHQPTELRCDPSCSAAVQHGVQRHQPPQDYSSVLHSHG